MASATLTALLPTNPSFAGHQTFSFRLGWLKKGVDALQDPEAGGPDLFAREDALVTLGVGKNMVQSIRHWLLVTRMAEEVNRRLFPTALGAAIFGGPDGPGWDPFLEGDATLWLLHWQLAGPGSLAFTWAHAFSLFREHEFSRDDLVEAIRRSSEGRVVKPPSRETIQRDVECLLHTYVFSDSRSGGDDGLDCPLRSLRLIRPGFERHFRFQIGSKPTLPGRIFAYAMNDFWLWKQAEAKTLSVWDLAYAEGSPGAVFKLNEDTVLEYLDYIDQFTEGAFTFEDTGLVRQVVRQGPVSGDCSALLERHYGC